MEDGARRMGLRGLRTWAVGAVPPAVATHVVSARGRYGGVGFRRCASWADAEAATEGHQDARIVGWQVERTRALRAAPVGALGDARFLRTAAAVFGALVEHPARGVIRVDDVGGQDGILFHQFCARFPEIQFEWTVFEVPEFVDALELEGLDSYRLPSGSAIRWLPHTSMGDQSSGGVTIAAGVVQLMPDPYETIGKLVRNSIALVLDKVWTAALGHDVAVARTPPISHGARYPAWFFDEDKFWRFAGSLGRVSLTWEDNAIMAFEGSRVALQGGLIQRSAGR